MPMGMLMRQMVGQGRGGYTISLDDSETATVRPRSYVNWATGGLSWIVFPGASGTITVEYSLRASGDAWLAADDSPFDATYGDSEAGQFERIRFTATGAAGTVDLLCDSKLMIEIV